VSPSEFLNCPASPVCISPFASVGRAVVPGPGGKASLRICKLNTTSKHQTGGGVVHTSQVSCLAARLPSMCSGASPTLLNSIVQPFAKGPCWVAYHLCLRMLCMSTLQQKSMGPNANSVLCRWPVKRALRPVHELLKLTCPMKPCRRRRPSIATLRLYLVKPLPPQAAAALQQRSTTSTAVQHIDPCRQRRPTPPQALRHIETCRRRALRGGAPLPREEELRWQRLAGEIFVSCVAGGVNF